MILHYDPDSAGAAASGRMVAISVLSGITGLRPFEWQSPNDLFRRPFSGIIVHFGTELAFSAAGHLGLFAEFAAIIVRENIGKLAAG